MATRKQVAAAKKNIKKAQEAWQGMSSRERALAQPSGRARKKPGAGEGEFYRIEVRPKDEFVTFRTQDMGKKGGIERLAGKRSSGSWDTATWLVSKDFAHIEGRKLVPDHPDARELFENLGSQPTRVKGDVFKAKDRPNVPEKAKPTPAQKRARSTNIKKAQAARHGAA
jgi:hypothetical protein